MAAHRYWRINIRGAASYPSMAEIELRDSIGGADRTGSGTATASVSYSTYTPDKAVDNNTATAWATYPNAAPQWWQYDFGAGNTYDIVEVVITPRQDGFYNEAPGDWDLQYSDNGSDWTTKRAFNGIVWASASAKTFEAPNLEDFAPHDLTSNTSHSPYVISSSAYSSSTPPADGYPPWKVFDNGQTVYLRTVLTEMPCWVGIDVGAGSERILRAYEIWVGQQYSDPTLTAAPKAWTIQGSNDGSNWDTIDTVSGQTGWYEYQRRYFECDVTTTAYRYFRIVITENNGFSGATVVAEMCLFGEAGSPPAASAQQPIVVIIC